MSRTSKLLAAVIVMVAIMEGAAPTGAALSQRPRSPMAKRQTQTPPVSLPHSVSFREVRGRGLLVQTWLNGAGPFNFAIDTGAGATIIAPRVAAAAAVNVSSRPGPSIAGLSGAVVSASDAVIRDLAIGDPQNYLPTNRDVIVSGGLPPDLDGLLDPNQAFGPLGYVIDIPARELSAFNPREELVTLQRQPSEGAVVQWLQQGNSHRPFVRLDNGEQVLIDTGSSLGFAVHDPYARDSHVRASAVYDVGGAVSTRRGAPQTISIGSLVLRNVPTDIISGAPAETPALLGLNALRPFRMRFDPLHHLIEITSVQRY